MPHPARTNRRPTIWRRLGRLVYSVAALASLFVCLGSLGLWLRLDRSEFWVDLLTFSRGGHCVMVKSARIMPYSEEILVLMYEAPWPENVPLTWSSGDGADRVVGPTRVGQVIVQPILEYAGVRSVSWHGFTVARWKDGSLMFDCSGYKASSYSEPMGGFSVGMSHLYWIMLSSVLPFFWTYHRGRRPATRARVCPECACDLPTGSTRCPDCGVPLAAEPAASKVA